MTVHVQIVGWNHRPYLDACIRSCLAQTVPVPVVYVDNASTDGSAEFVRKTFPSVRIRENRQNRGYAGGHNNGLNVLPNTDVAILLNPDVVLDRTFVEECLKGFSEPRAGAVVPLLMRGSGEWGVGSGDASERQASGTKHQTPVIDAFGTVLLPTLRAVNQYEGEPVTSIIHHEGVPVPPWGFTGAAVALRREALVDVAVWEEIFDEDLFSYREDVDLSWRLHRRNWRIVAAATARATHIRAIRTGGKKSARIAQLSWRNYFLVIVKNAPRGVLLTQALPVIGESAARLAQLLVTPSAWPAMPELFRFVPRFLKKRRHILSKTR